MRRIYKEYIPKRPLYIKEAKIFIKKQKKKKHIE